MNVCYKVYDPPGFSHIASGTNWSNKAEIWIVVRPTRPAVDAIRHYLRPRIVLETK